MEVGMEESVAARVDDVEARDAMSCSGVLG